VRIGGLMSLFLPSTAGRVLGMRTWRELGLVASVTRADVGGIKDYTMVPVSQPVVHSLCFSD